MSRPHPRRSPFDPGAPTALVGGCHGTGLSLLSALLDAHDDIVCGPDVNLMCHPVAWQAEGDAFARCMAALLAAPARPAEGALPWATTEAAKLGWYLTSAAELRAGLQEFGSIGELMRFVHAARRVVERKSWAVDISAGNLFAMHVALVREPGLKAIVTMRDGRAVLRSRMRAGLSMPAAAAQWVLGAALARDLLERHGAHRVHIVRFEDLVEQPSDVLDALCAFLGVAPQAERMLARGSLRARTDGSLDGTQRGMPRWTARPLEPLQRSAASAGRAGVAIRHLQLLASTQLAAGWLHDHGLRADLVSGAALMAHWQYPMEGREVAGPVRAPSDPTFGASALERFFAERVQHADAGARNVS